MNGDTDGIKRMLPHKNPYDLLEESNKRLARAHYALWSRKQRDALRLLLEAHKFDKDNNVDEIIDELAMLS